MEVRLWKRPCAAILLVLVVTLLASCGASESFIETYNDNWDIALPPDGEELYSYRIHVGFRGQGYRYTVLSYPSFQSVEKSVAWEPGPYQALEEELDGLITKMEELDDVELDASYFPTWENDYHWFAQKHSGVSSAITYLVFDNVLNRLYVFELI